MKILISPVITEKSIGLASQGIYSFVVAPSSTKHSIANSVETQFGVNVLKVTVNTVHVPAARTGRLRKLVSRSNRKIARVFLKKGQTISLFDLKEE